ncbi:zinc dependent phospholipase C family protein [Hymenobacter sp. H14-R3]|uniref:zinc dependent phospholipase C family protein n=1 Tax=Hymenobacter sp. H14-R3 TaxID=3046308 RepID=UPI0024BB7C07|nr:zinc dependent phospholipase C family protein [Hymenobacter sp. H14-R3]MDJ0366956.1 zinc dependent phospholipase C family protein [Hymenobacter sp. H14-R3]
MSPFTPNSLRIKRWLRRCLVLLLLVQAWPATAYSVLTHQSVIDSTWNKYLLPQLQLRYPGGNKEDWLLAKSYAYGGAIVQDMGYYPLGAELFTSLTHYVRSGDFVANLLRDAHGRNEYAFALGALAHYASDNVGHPEATNLVLPNVYPKKKAEFGPVITYEQAPINHTEVEFSFDVVQIAAGHYRSQDYHKYVGFRASKHLLERAFRDTYGIELGQVVFNVDVSLAAFRLAVNQLLPAAARAAWVNQRKAIRRISPRARRRDYVYHTSRRAYQKEFGTDAQWPGLGARILAGVLSIMPKIGPLRAFAFNVPSAADEARFRRSYRDALARYVVLVREQPTDTAATKAAPPIPNTNLDTGRPTRPTEYILADVTYQELLRELQKDKFKLLTPALQQNILAFYAAGPAPSAPPARHTKATEDEDKNSRKNHKNREESQAALNELRHLSPAATKP